jgi:hypothetical protein
MIELESDFQKFLNANFAFAENMFDGAVDIYSSADMKLRIVRDRNAKLYMSVSTLENPQNSSDWIILSDLRSYMLDNDDYLKEIEFYEISTFFRENYEKVILLLISKYDIVQKALRERGHYRAQVMFGPIPKQESRDLPKSAKDDQQVKKKPWWK